MKKFRYAESNLCIDLAIKVEKLKKMLNQKLDKGEINITQFREISQNLNNLMNKNIDLIENWQDKIRNK